MKTIFLVESGHYEDRVFIRAFTDVKKAEKFFLHKYASYYPNEEGNWHTFQGGRKVLLSGHHDYGTWCQLLEVKL